MGPLVVPIITGAISLFGSLFGAHKQSSAASKAAKYQTDAQLEAARIAKQAADEALAETRRESDRSWASNEAARRGNYDISAARERRLGTIGAMVGLGPREIPDYVADPGATGGSGATNGGAAGTDAAELKKLLDAGLSPQDAAAKFNQQFKRTTGNEAVYYDPSQHGGIATIGLPGAYLSQEPNGWGITIRGGSGTGTGESSASDARSQTIRDILQNNAAANQTYRRTPRTPALIPGSIAQYAVGRY